MRLIDADELKEIVSGYGCAGFWSLRIEKISEIIDGQSTAYDVDNVVKQLEEKLKKIKDIKKECEEEEDDEGASVGLTVQWNLEQAIEIVKSGGIE